MNQLVAEFEKVLESERQFALHADVDGLGAIQGEKQVLLQQLLASGAPEAETRKLREKAMANIQLIRHLCSCLKAVSSPPGATYTAAGDRASGGMKRSWGRL